MLVLMSALVAMVVPTSRTVFMLVLVRMFMSVAVTVVVSAARSVLMLMLM